MMNRLLLCLSFLLVMPLSACSTARSRTSDVVVHDNGIYAQGAVAADHAIASEAGARMLAMGGNAVDAAVAASFTLSVVRPYSCGIGGGGFMVIHLPDDPKHGMVHTAVNYREQAYVDADYYERTGKSSTIGGAAVAIPGSVAGLLHALETYGTLDRKTVLTPAIEAAYEGFVVDEHYMIMSGSLMEKFQAHPEFKQRAGLVWTHFLRQGQVQLGDRITNSLQAKALERIARDGVDGFYRGPVGDAIVRAITEAGGEMTSEQLAGYTLDEREPLVREVEGRSMIAMPPPSSGGVTMLQALMILEASNYDFANPIMDADRAHLLVEALKHAFADRSNYLADPDFVDVPIDDLLDESIIQERAQLITDGVHPPSYYGTPNLVPNDAGTSHVSVVDPYGGAVAMTETINLSFGSLVGVDAYGFVLNNEMDDFTTVRGQPNAFGLMQSDRNLPEPGKRPLSSMSPTIVLDDNGEVFAVAGASGGPRIITGTMQALLNTMAGMDATPAVATPRLHHQWLPDVLYSEPGLMPLLSRRAARGDWNEVKLRRDVGNVQLIRRDPDGQGWQAASDPRKGGIPAGVD
ncbi:MAG: gamma-glutamyltransferase [Phycisphaerae bacterium]|nr:gamma-glutamyltransferase [Phycisphaerae bacterium]MBM90731.1 gamma-glutamyltransferase [Phycisphaerae bacterium]